MSAGSRTIPSGVMSKNHAIISAIGKPTSNVSVIARGTQLGNCICGASVATTWISSHATTR